MQRERSSLVEQGAEIAAIEHRVDELSDSDDASAPQFELVATLAYLARIMLTIWMSRDLRFERPRI